MQFMMSQELLDERILSIYLNVADVDIRDAGRRSFWDVYDNRCPNVLRNGRDLVRCGATRRAPSDNVKEAVKIIIRSRSAGECSAVANTR